MIERNTHNHTWGICLTSLFRYSLKYDFIKLFFELDNIANWKPFIRYNMENIVYNTITSNEFKKILPIIVKYINMGQPKLIYHKQIMETIL